jgi:5-methylcytosine-specific restriction protein A
MRVAATRRRRKAIEEGNNAAARLRKTIRARGVYPCAKCGLTFLASALDVDHITPLALGGEDVDENVQALCRPDHKLKTRTDFGFANTPF